jgi:hypothetical protein
VNRSSNAEQIKLISVMAILVVKIFTRGDGGGYGEVCFLRMSGVTRPVLCWRFWQQFYFSLHEYVFIFNLLYEGILQMLFYRCSLKR